MLQAKQGSAMYNQDVASLIRDHFRELVEAHETPAAEDEDEDEIDLEEDASK